MGNLLHDMQPWFDALASGLWRAAWQGAIAIAAAWLVVRYCRFIPPRAACWVWRLVCAKLLVSLVALAPVNIPILAIAPAPPAVPVAESPIAHDADAEIEPEPNRPIQAARQPIVESRAPQSVASNWNWLLAVWAAGVGGCMWLTFRRWRAVRALRRASTASAIHSLDAICRQEAERLHVSRLPKLRISSLIAVPLLAGIRRPVLLLPAGAAESFHEPELRMIIAHELAHLKRHDLLWNWLATVVGWLFFFNPMVWLLKGAWADAQESACDELLVQNNSGIAVAYAELLIKVARQWPREPAMSLMAAGVLGTYQNLRRRILVMAEIKPLSHHRLFTLAAAAFVIAALGIVPWRLVAEQPQKSAAAQDRANKGTKQAARDQQEQKEAELLARMSKDFGYRLEAGENLRRIAPPFPAIRFDMCRLNGRQAKSTGPDGALFRWSDGQLELRTSAYGQYQNCGFTFDSLLESLFGIRRQYVDCSVLDQYISGDWIERKGLSADQGIHDLAAILDKQLAMPLTMEFRYTPRTVYVVTGDYKYKQLPGARNPLPHGDWDDIVEVFARKPARPARLDGRCGNFSEFLEDLGSYIDAPIYSEAKQPPKGKIVWLFERDWTGELSKLKEAEDQDPGLVLPNITKQTGLQFHKETRTVRMLLIYGR